MGLLGTLKETLEASTQSTNRGTGTQQSKGAYWCHDCDERLLDLDVEVEGELKGEAGDESDVSPACPDCGEEMEFERSPGSTGCAC
ncbi:MAG: hypothetical protein ABEJ79_08390 [Halolamina sp.]